MIMRLWRLSRKTTAFSMFENSLMMELRTVGFVDFFWLEVGGRLFLLWGPWDGRLRLITRC